MTDSPSSQLARALGLGAAIVALGALLVACGTPGAGLSNAPLEPLPRRAAAVPEAPALGARDVAAAALLGRTDAAAGQRAGLEELEDARRARGAASSGLVPVAIELENATLGDRFAWRSATRELLERDDLEPARRTLLEQELEDDPLRLANLRLADARRARFARVFNTLAEVVGRSVLTTALAPYRLARALVRLAAQQSVEEPISTPERQALAHWKQYVETQPDTPQAAELVGRIESLQARWYEMQRERHLALARHALEAGQDERALVLAGRVLRYAPEDGEALALRESAGARRERRRAAERRSLAAPEAAPLDVHDANARRLALALLVPGADAEAAARSLLEAEPEGALADAARFAAAHADDSESARWKAVEAIAREDPARSSMARHARALLRSPSENPWAAFRAARSQERRMRARWALLGPLANPARHDALPRPLGWTLDAFSLVEVVAGLPMRALRAPFATTQRSAMALHARQYLERRPEGEHAPELRRWLVTWEAKRGNAIGAHHLAEVSDLDPERVARLRERAAEQAVEGASRQTRVDVRIALLGRAASEYAGTEAARRAGRELRQEIQHASAQRIRISRGYLTENPELAGPAALALRAELLDDDPANGELHPDGVFLVGGRTIEFAMLDEAGDPEAPPRTVRRRVSAERLARIVARLEETSRRNALVDPDTPFEADADRDLFFERARLGVVDGPDERATAHSSYAFRGLRERYGMVRSRESILPVELVIQGSFPDLGLGAFPRFHMPKPTPDAILYK